MIDPTISNASLGAAGLGATAYWTASVRARETRREDCLLADPWAEALAGEIGMRWLAQRPEDSTLPIVLRTRYFDDFVQQTAAQQQTTAQQQAAAQPEICQVVLVAAGLDTRAFRLAWPPGTRLFELDQPAVLAYKEEVLRALGAQPACQRAVLPHDLARPMGEALAAGGFDRQAPACWLLEGFLFYLPSAEITRLLEEVDSLAATGSWLGFDVINSAMLTSPYTRPWLEMQAQAGAPWIGVLDDPAGFLAARGWTARLTQAGQPDAHHGRWTLPVFPTLMPGVPHNWFVTARKGESTSKP